jgi:flagellar biosynthesis/type III secretory pathway M-ring protein FliF/YscJ
MPLRELEASAADVHVPGPPAESAVKKGVEQVADSTPDRVAQQVRIWMNEA